MASRSKACIYGPSPPKTVGSNPAGGMDVCCECCMLAGRDLCYELITLPEESYRLWCVVLCDLRHKALVLIGPQRFREKNAFQKSPNVM